MRTFDRETAQSRARLDQLQTNVKTAKRGRITLATPEILATLRARWSAVAANGITRHDVLAGVTVATVAIPLNVALAIAAHLPASAGLLAGAVGGMVAAAFGGSNYQVSGPAAALNVMVFGIVAQFGIGGAAAAALVCGAVALAVGILGFGRFANLLPKIVLAGFTTGVGLKLLDQQIPILLGVKHDVWSILTHSPNLDWLRDVHWHTVVCGLLVAWITVGLAHLKSFPSALLGIVVATGVAFELDWSVARVGEVSLGDLAPSLPLLMPGTGWLALIAATIPLALLSCAESLISAKAVDELSKGKSDFHANTELVGQGLGNLAAGLVGAMPVSGVIVRSSVNLQAGGRTRLAAVFHGVILLVAAYGFGHLLAVIPLAALAGLLVVIAWRLVHLHDFGVALKANKLHALAFLAAAIGTVLGHLMTGLVVGCALVYVERWFTKRAAANRTGAVIRPSPAIRAVVTEAGSPAQDHGLVPMREQAVWQRQVRTRPKVHPSAYVHPAATVIGWVEVGREVNIAADTSVRADEGAPFYIGDRSNVQDGVVMHALKEKWVTVEGRQWAIYIGHDVSLAHQALVHGPSMVGPHCFVGFKAIVHDSIIGAGCFISHNATVVGVEIPPGRRVPTGWVVDSPEKVKELPLVEHAHSHFNEDVVLVNRGLAAAYALETPAEPYRHPDAELPVARVVSHSSLKSF